MPFSGTFSSLLRVLGLWLFIHQQVFTYAQAVHVESRTMGTQNGTQLSVQLPRPQKFIVPGGDLTIDFLAFESVIPSIQGRILLNSALNDAEAELVHHQRRDPLADGSWSSSFESWKVSLESRYPARFGPVFTYQNLVDTVNGLWLFFPSSITTKQVDQYFTCHFEVFTTAKGRRTGIGSGVVLHQTTASPPGNSAAGGGGNSTGVGVVAVS